MCDVGVDARRVVAKRPLKPARNRTQLRLHLGDGVELLPVVLVGRELARTEDLRQRPLRVPAHEIHLHEPVLGLGVPDPEPHPVQGAAADVRNPVAVARDRDPVMAATDCQGRC